MTIAIIVLLKILYGLIMVGNIIMENLQQMCIGVMNFSNLIDCKLQKYSVYERLNITHYNKYDAIVFDVQNYREISREYYYDRW